MFFYWIFIGLVISVHNSALVFPSLCVFCKVTLYARRTQLIFLFIYVVLLFVDVLDRFNTARLEEICMQAEKVMDYSMDDFFHNKGNILYSF